MLFDVDVVRVLHIDLWDLIMNDVMIDLNSLNVLERDWDLNRWYSNLMPLESQVLTEIYEDNEDCRLEIEDRHEYSREVIHV